MNREAQNNWGTMVLAAICVFGAAAAGFALDVPGRSLPYLFAEGILMASIAVAAGNAMINCLIVQRRAV